MRREFGTAEPPLSEVELGRGRANGLVHVHCLPPRARLKASEAVFLLLSLQGHVKVKLVKNSRRVRPTCSHGYTNVRWWWSVVCLLAASAGWLLLFVTSSACLFFFVGGRRRSGLLVGALLRCLRATAFLCHLLYMHENSDGVLAIIHRPPSSLCLLVDYYSTLRNKNAGPLGAAALQGRGDNRGRKERGPPQQ